MAERLPGSIGRALPGESDDPRLRRQRYGVMTGQICDAPLHRLWRGVAADSILRLHHHVQVAGYLHSALVTERHRLHACRQHGHDGSAGAAAQYDVTHRLYKGRRHVSKI